MIKTYIKSNSKRQKDFWNIAKGKIMDGLVLEINVSIIDRWIKGYEKCLFTTFSQKILSDKLLLVSKKQCK